MVNSFVTQRCRIFIALIYNRQRGVKWKFILFEPCLPAGREPIEALSYSVTTLTVRSLWRQNGSWPASPGY